MLYQETYLGYLVRNKLKHGTRVKCTSADNTMLVEVHLAPRHSFVLQYCVYAAHVYGTIRAGWIQGSCSHFPRPRCPGTPWRAQPPSCWPLWLVFGSVWV